MVVCLLLVLQFVVPVVADTLPRHQDPQTLGPQPPDVGSLFNLYGFVFNMTAAENYTGAVSWLDWARLVYTTPGSESLIDGYNGQLGAFISGMNMTKTDLDLARENLRHLRTDDLEALLQRIQEDLNKENVTLHGLQSTSLDLATLLKRPPDALLAGVDALRVLHAEYAQQVELIIQSMQNVGTLNATILSINVAPKEILVGSKIMVTGKLTDVLGNALGTRYIEVLFDDKVVGVSAINGSGVFVLELSAPFVYEDILNVTAEYWPSGGDAIIYLPSASNEVHVKLIYYTPVIDVSVPKIVYPGKMLMIEGNVTYGGASVAGVGVNVVVFGFDMVTVSGIGGGFSFEVPVPRDSVEGTTSITLASLADGVYAPVKALARVDVVRQPMELSVDAPSWAVSGFPVRVKGTASSEGTPVANCSVRLESGVGSVITRTRSDGGFEVELSPPLVLGTENYPFVVKATPVEPWIRSSSFSGEVFMTNLLTLVGGSVLVIAVGFYASKKIQRKPRTPSMAREEPLVAEPTTVTVVPIVAVEPEGVRDSYAYALGVVSRKTGVIPRPSSTLREYLVEVWGSLGENGGPFRSLTMLYEGWLYDRDVDVNLGAIRVLLRRVRELFSV